MADAAPAPVRAPAPAAPTVEIVALANSDAVVDANLFRSPVVADGRWPVTLVRDAPSASRGYNLALAAASADVILLIHQDVYLPAAFERDLLAAVADLDRHDPAWAVFGAFGIGLQGEGLGDVWSSSIGRRIGEPPRTPQPVQSVDELLIGLRRSSGLRFDEALPGFHMYGTDIVQQATERGAGAYAVHLPCVHNDKFKGTLGYDFTEAYQYVAHRWRRALPIRTTITTVTTAGIPYAVHRLRCWRGYDQRKVHARDPSADPRSYAAEAGID